LLSVTTPAHALDESASTGAVNGASARRSTETKPAFKTTEFVVFLVAVLGVLVASALVGESDGRGDVFLADKAWFYVTLLTIGYLVSRGLAKAGSRAHHDA
jgi:hypothetical protein